MVSRKHNVGVVNRFLLDQEMQVMNHHYISH